MNSACFLFRTVGIYSKRLYVSLSNRSKKVNVSNHGTKVKLLIGFGLAPLIPIVSAQNELKNEELIKVKEMPQPTDEEITQTLDGRPTKGWDRLVAVFETDEYGNMSREMVAISQTTSLAFLIGLIYGGITSSRRAFIDFMERNQATIFENHIDAKRRLQNHVTIHFGKGAWHWGWRLTLFTGGFVLFLTTITAYRGQSSILDYSMSGALVGALVRIKLGPPGMIVGGCLGGVLATVCGLATKGLLSVSGTSLDDIISYQYEIDRNRMKQFGDAAKNAIEKGLESEATDILNAREETQNKKLENIN